MAFPPYGLEAGNQQDCLLPSKGHCFGKLIGDRHGRCRLVGGLGAHSYLPRRDTGLQVRMSSLAFNERMEGLKDTYLTVLDIPVGAASAEECLAVLPPIQYTV